MKNIRQSILKRFNRMRQDKMALVRHNDCSFVLDTRNSLDMKLMGGMNWEHGLRDRAVAEINNQKLDLFIDAGANLGLYTIDLNKRCQGLRDTLAFEPVPSNYNQLCGNIFMNELSDRVTALRTALSDTDGNAVLHVDTKFTIHSTFENAPERAGKFDKSINVSLMKFDAHHNYEGRRAFLKMDVEGHENAALTGMTGFLTRNKASLQIESGASHFEAIGKLLNGLGYRYNGKQNNDHFFDNF